MLMSSLITPPQKIESINNEPQIVIESVEKINTLDTKEPKAELDDEQIDELEVVTPNQIVATETNNNIIATQKTTANTSSSSSNSNSSPNTTAPTTTPSTPTPSVPNTPSPTQPTTPSNDTIINLKLNSGNVIKIELEDYIVGVVAAEMPASFNIEALKAQALAARTYALKKTSGGATISASISDQAYKTDSELKSMWGSSYNTYYNKIKGAVTSTKGEYIAYGGKYIDALYFSTSNGKTEDPVFVWGNSVAYLKSVNSPADVGVSTYSSTKTITLSELSAKVGVTLNSSSNIKVLNKTTGNRVKTAVFGTKQLTGVQVRTLLGLRSADFDISINGNNITFTCRGYGHGVGMSQYGANEMGKQGSTYSQIIKHYYTGVSILKK
ncbi:Amidase enhancer precursor [compost metagenome]